MDGYTVLVTRQSANFSKTNKLEKATSTAFFFFEVRFGSFQIFGGKELQIFMSKWYTRISLSF